MQNKLASYSPGLTLYSFNGSIVSIQNPKLEIT